jgi:polyisoprenoid-binding protein YceI
MKAFTFEQALMQEHFNENYVESDKYPDAIFKGTITNISSVSYDKDGSYPVSVKGKMTMHNVTKDVEAAGKITVNKGKVSASSGFSVQLADYNIKIPALAAGKLDKTAKITVSCGLEPLK